MIKWVCIVIALYANYSYGRGAAKANSNYGDGNVLANSYCQYVGLDCSSTCCIQQSCAASLSDCEYGISTDLYYMYYIAAGIIGLIGLIPILVKVISLCFSIEFRKSCFRSSSKIQKTKKESNIFDLRYRSKIMKKLQRGNFSIDESLDEHYLRPIEDLEEMKSMFEQNKNIDNFEPNHFEIDEMNHNDSRSKKPAFGSQRETDQYGNMISNQPYKNNESTNKDEISEDSADRESVEITRQKLNEDHKKTITPIELAPKFHKDKSRDNFPTINDELQVVPFSKDSKDENSEESKSNKGLRNGSRNDNDNKISNHKSKRNGNDTSIKNKIEKAEGSKNGSDTKALSHNEKGPDNVDDFDMEI